MLTEQERDRVCVVLVRARNPSNIGAAARAMHDFGFSRLRVVNEFAAPFEGARSAVDASEVLARAVRCASVAEAVADCTLVAGTTAVGRGGLSILSNVGLPELVARDVGQYQRIAVELARDLPRLGELRRTLRARMRNSPLMDGPRFARHVEAAYRRMWQRWCAGQGPAEP